MHQPSLLEWAPARGKTDTSRAAAEAIEPRADTLRRRCLDLIADVGPYGVTADECAAVIRETVLSIRPRFTELRVAGRIVDSGARRKNSSGRSAIVWTANKTETEK